MTRIRIEDLPIVDEPLTPEELAQLEGAGRPSFRPGVESLEAREMLAANILNSLPPVLDGARNVAQVQQTTPGSGVRVDYGNAFAGAMTNQVMGQNQVKGPIADLSKYKDVRDALKGGSNWIIYEPAVKFGGQQVGADQIQRELKMLYDRGFRGIVTYAFNNGRENIPAIAKKIGFQQVIAGFHASGGAFTGELKNLTPDRMKAIDGYCVGNETQLRRLAGSADSLTMDQLSGMINQVRNLTHKPTTTADAWHLYAPENQPGKALMALGDFVFPNFHPYYQPADHTWNPHKNIDEAVKFVTDVLGKTFNQQATGGRIVALHESWWPSAAPGEKGDYAGSSTPQQQRDYFQKLSKTNVAFVYGEAFDQAWKSGERSVDAQGQFGGHWGLYNADGTPKIAVDILYLGDRPK